MANEKRLIDANAMHKFVEDKVAEGKDGWANGVPYEWAYALTAVDMQPTVDAVEVVRCAKCKHYQQYHKGRTEELCEWGKCKLISMDVDMPCNGFCCFGERRNDHVQKPV